MSIEFDQTRANFHLKTKGTSYVIHLINRQYLQHVYWGKRVENFGLDYLDRYFFRPGSGKVFTKDEWTLDTITREYPSYGSSDLRSPAIQVQFEDGSTISELAYVSHRIFAGKAPLEGLPATYAEKDSEAQTLEITLKDPLSGLEAILSYTVFEDFDAMTRSVKLVNAGAQKLKILRVLSMNVDFFDSDFEMLQLSGRWSSERQIVRRQLASGSQSIESRRGISSHQQNPFLALARPGSTEESGEIYSANFVYSGNFLANAEVDQNGCTRMQMGINPFDFTWVLGPGEAFQAPEAVMVYSSEGYGSMSRIYHDLYRSRLCRGKFRDELRPIVVNNWEATYFNFDEEKLLTIAKQAKELGIEMFVLDDGWFGRRDSDNCSLGDWVVDPRKLPNGMDGLADQINRLGLQFGLWFEPEMVSPDSDLYRAHPDWCLHVDGRVCSLGRHQLVLDLSRADVRDYIIRSLKAVLSSAHIEYVKWDMNRCLSEIGSAALPAEKQRETAHRYVLGLYAILEEITSSFPDILFESCASGGGRFDPAFLYYMPQTWTSDMTDAVARLKIQYGTSLPYPAVTMSAHVSDVPNHQNGRVTPLSTRGNCAMAGTFGYELDLSKMTDGEKETVRRQVEEYKAIRRTIQFGDLYRLVSPFTTNSCAYMYVAKNGSEAVVSYFRILGEFAILRGTLRLQGLEPSARYRVDGTDEVYGGDELMNAGLVLPALRGDFASCTWKLTRVSD
jgi:alpha-galactosidase